MIMLLNIEISKQHLLWGGIISVVLLFIEMTKLIDFKPLNIIFRIYIVLFSICVFVIFSVSILNFILTKLLTFEGIMTALFLLFVVYKIIQELKYPRN